MCVFGEFTIHFFCIFIFLCMSNLMIFISLGLHLYNNRLSHRLSVQDLINIAEREFAQLIQHAHFNWEFHLSYNLEFQRKSFESQLIANRCTLQSMSKEHQSHNIANRPTAIYVQLIFFIILYVCISFDPTLRPCKSNTSSTIPFASNKKSCILQKIAKKNEQLHTCTTFTYILM